MTETQKCNEIMNYFDEKIFNPALDFAKRNPRTSSFSSLEFLSTIVFKSSSKRNI